MIVQILIDLWTRFGSHRRLQSSVDWGGYKWHHGTRRVLGKYVHLVSEL